MGVLGFFRWLRRKYPSILERAEALDEEDRKTEFHNLFFDLNAIIHHCSHPEHEVTTCHLKLLLIQSQSVPKDEQEMTKRMEDRIEMIFSMVLPTELLFFAIGESLHATNCLYMS